MSGKQGELARLDPRLRYALLGLLAAGALLWLWQCVTRGSLWNDEAALAFNVIGRDLSQIGRPFIFSQVAPYLFMLSEKLMAAVFGSSDFALRAFPMLAGIATLPLIAAVAWRLAGPRAGLVALALAVTAHRLLYYAQELKPYSLDACIAAGLVLLGLSAAGLHSAPDLADARNAASPRSMRSLHVLGLVGAIAPWFSLTSVFVLAGVGLALFADLASPTRDAVPLTPGDKKRRALLLTGYVALWLASFGLQYSMFLHVPAENRAMQTYYQVMNGYAPFPPRSFDDVRWYVGRFFYWFLAPGGFRRVRYLAGFVFIGGAARMFVRQRWLMLMLVVPWLAVLGTSAIHRYVLQERLVLFLVPSMYILLTLAIDALFAQVETGRKVLGGMILLALVASPLHITLDRIRLRGQHPDLEDVVAQLAHEYRPGDAVYVDPETRCPFEYYARAIGLETHYVSAGNSHLDIAQHSAVIDTLAGKPRVWVLIASVAGILPDNPSIIEDIQTAEAGVVKHLDQMGTKLARRDGGSVALYLYDLRGNTATATR